MLSRDPVRRALAGVEEVLGANLRDALPLLRLALRHGGVLGAARGGRVALAGLGRRAPRGCL